MEVVQVAVDENIACGGDSFPRNSKRVYYVVYCKGDLKCTSCLTPNFGTYKVCRGSAGQIMANLFISSISLLLIKSLN